MEGLSKYSFSNAKIRAMLSYLIPQEELFSLSEAKNINEILEKLRRIPYYKNVFKKSSEKEVDLKVIEKSLRENDLKIFKKVYNSLFTKREKNFISIFIQKYEIEELKVALRIWHRKIHVNIEDYFLEERISFDINFKEIISSKNLDQIILLLDKTPYKKPLLEAKKNFEEKNSTFYLESSLDIDYYERLISAGKKLSTSDRKIIEKILGATIDIENISLLFRSKKYYSLSAETLSEWVIPYGKWKSKDKIINAYSDEEFLNVLKGISKESFIDKKLDEKDINFIESFLKGIIIKEIRKCLSGFPFTIGIPLSYLILKEKETEFIISLLYAKRYNWEKNKIISLLKS